MLDSDTYMRIKEAQSYSEIEKYLKTFKRQPIAYFDDENSDV